MIGKLLRSFGLLALIATFPAAGQQSTSVVLGTATTGGGFEIYGAALATTISEVDPQLKIDIRKTAGSLENIKLLESGQLDLALVQGEATHDAFSTYAEQDPMFRIVAAMYPTAGMFVVRADSPYRTIDDLKGHPVVFGARGSGLVTLARYVLEGMGLDINRDFQAITLDRAGDAPAMLQDGRVAAIWGGGRGWPVFTAAMNMPGGGRFIAPDPKQIIRILVRHPFLKKQTLSPDTYPGQTIAIESVGSWSFILARQGLPRDVVYRFCRALDNGRTRFAELLPQASDSTIENTITALERRELLHPGARRYLEERGVLK